MCIKPSTFKLLVPDLCMNGKPLVWVAEQEYLGILITDDLSDNIDIKRQIRSTYARGNALLRKFSKCSNKVKSRLFKAYMENFYGAQLWCNYSTTMLSCLKVAYNNTFRFLFGIKRGGSITSILLNFGINPFYVNFRRIMYSFRTRIFTSGNSLIKHMVDSSYFLNEARLLKNWSYHLNSSSDIC